MSFSTRLYILIIITLVFFSFIFFIFSIKNFDFSYREKQNAEIKALALQIYADMLTSIKYGIDQYLNGNYVRFIMNVKERKIFPEKKRTVDYLRIEKGKEEDLITVYFDIYEAQIIITILLEEILDKYKIDYPIMIGYSVVSPLYTNSQESHLKFFEKNSNSIIATKDFTLNLYYIPSNTTLLYFKKLFFPFIISLLITFIVFSLLFQGIWESFKISIEKLSQDIRYLISKVKEGEKIGRERFDKVDKDLDLIRDSVEFSYMNLSKYIKEVLIENSKLRRTLNSYIEANELILDFINNIKDFINYNNLKLSGYEKIVSNSIKSISKNLDNLNFLDFKEFETVFSSIEKNFSILIKDIISSEKLKNSMMYLLTLVELKDNLSFDHTLNVGNLSYKIAEKLGLDDLDRFFIASILHDLGKILIQENLFLTSKLKKKEKETIFNHTKLGFNLVLSLPLEDKKLKNMIATINIAHHENFDGSGYPYGIEGEDIPIYARIIRVVDSFDVMQRKRIYRKKVYEKEEALKELIKGKGTLYDPKIVDTLIKVIQENK